MKSTSTLLRQSEEIGAKFTLMQTQGNKIPTDHSQSMANNDFRLEDVQSK